jgi:integrase
MAQHQTNPGGAPGNPPTITGPKRRLTEAAIARIKPPASGRLQIPDGHLTGLWLRVTNNGVKSWSVLYRANGGPVRRLTLGRWPAMGVSVARTLARDALLTAAKGEDPAATRRADREQSSDRFEAVAAEFVKRRVRARGLRTAAEIEGTINKYLSAWSGRRIGSIGKADVLKVIDGISDAGHRRQANKTLQLIRRLFAWAEQRDLIDRNPAAGIEKPHAERSRDRVLEDHELAAVWRAAGTMGWPWAPWVRLLILLGQRRSEVAGARWEDLDLEAGLWRMPGELTKMGRARELPLPGAAVEIIRALPRIAG